MTIRESIPFVAVALFITIALFFLYLPLSTISFGVLIFILYFFRDPKRTIPDDKNVIVSPADGKVIIIDECDEPIFSKGKMKRIAIFLSVLDVHVNRSPYESRVIAIKYQPGKFLDARNPDAGSQNETQNWLLDTSHGALVVRQIAGAIARRIVAWKQENDILATGERIGMIRFGSRTDIYLPQQCKIQVKIGDRVKGASSIIATWPK